MANNNKFTVWGNNSASSYGTYPAEDGFSAGGTIKAADFNNLLRAYSLLAVALGQKLIPGVNADSNPVTINDSLDAIIAKLNWLPNDLITDGLAWHNLEFTITAGSKVFNCITSFPWKNKSITRPIDLNNILTYLLPINTSKIMCSGYCTTTNEIISLIVKTSVANTCAILYGANNTQSFNMLYYDGYSNIKDTKLVILQGVS